MKKILIISLTLIVNLGFSQGESNPKSNVILVMYRKGDWDLFTNATILVNGEKICKLSKEKYLRYELKPGQLKINAQEAGYNLYKLGKHRKTELNLVAEAGKTYYVICKGNRIQVGRGHYYKFEMQEVPESMAKPDLEKLKPDHCMTKDRFAPDSLKKQ